MDLSALEPEDLDFAIRTIIGEAGNQPFEGQQAVGNVILNRAASGGSRLKDVVLAKSQFEPWSTRSRELMSYSPEDPKYTQAAMALDAALRSDPTEGATHFYAPKAQAALGRRPPAWDNGTGFDIGDHRFFRLGAGSDRQNRPAQVAFAGGLPEGFQLVDDEPQAQAAPAPAGLPAGFELVDEQAPAKSEPTPNARVAQAFEGQTTRAPGWEAGDEATARDELAKRLELQQRREAAGGGYGAAVGQGLAANFGDEIAGLWETAKAGDLNENGSDAYRRGAERVRDLDARFEAQHPVGSAVANTVGAVAAAPFLPVAGGSAASALGRIGGAAATGAGYGALYGAGSGEGVSDTLGQAAGGAVIGGAAGAVATPLIEGAVAGARGIARRVGTALNPEGEAARRVATAITRDAGGQPGAVTQAADNLEAARTTGSPQIVADQGGETTRSLARSSANTSPEGREALEGATNPRYYDQSDRTARFVQDLTGAGGDNAGTRDALRAQAARVNRPAYARAEADAQRAGGVWNPELEQLATAPAVRNAMAQAERRSSNRAAAEGARPVRNPFTEAEDGTIGLRVNDDGSRAVPSLAFWDQVKRGLDDQFETLQRQGARAEAADVNALRRQLLDTLDASVPSYAAARRGAAAFFGADDAVDAGSKFVTSKLANPEARRAVAAMSDPERRLFADGFASQLINTVREAPDRADVVNRIMQSPAARERVEIALGRQATGELEAFLRAENVMNMTRRAVTGNSTTARQLTEIGLAGGAGLAVSGGNIYDPNAWLTAALVAGGRRGSRAIDVRVARRVAEMLASDNPETLRRAARTIARNPAIAKALASAEQLLAKGGAPGAGGTGFSPLPAIASGRAQDGNPKAERPVRTQ